ncbi:MAG: methylated-DNA--[protein]-cysteine S-methyltransferase [Waddliaceae bacterium]
MLSCHSQGPNIGVEFFVREGEIVQTKLFPRDAEGVTWELFSDSRCPLLESKVSSWMDQYCSGKQSKEQLPVTYRMLSPFTQSVLTRLISLPFGGHLSYMELASEIGRPKACRAVGNACGHNPLPLIIPCHRVLAHNQRLGGFSLGLTLKKRLLQHEGVLQRGGL